MTSNGTDDPTQAQVVDQPFRSNLQDGPQRFLAYAIEHGLKCGRRTPRDFIRHFPPDTIMEGLEDEPQLRANILVAATGTRMKVALKKSATSCGSDLQIALDEHETDAETVVGLFAPDDRVRFLDNRALWNFLVEGEFWQVDSKKDAKGHVLAAQHISYLIERALEDHLLTHRDVVKGITVDSMAKLLPRSELPKIINAALELGQAKQPFVERNLLDSIGISTLAAHIPLTSIWTQVVVPSIAEAHGLVKKRDDVQEVVDARGSAREQNTDARPAESAQRPSAAEAEQTSAPPQRPATGAFSMQRPGVAAPAVAKAPAALGDDSGLDLEVDELLGSLGGAGKAPSKKVARRPGSIPPTA